MTARFQYKIVQDTDPSNPRKEWENAGTMACYHSRYSLGDKNGPQELIDAVCAAWNRISAKDREEIDYSSNPAIYAEMFQKYNLGIILPLHLYDHSGLSISTGAFSCPWDSGQIGWIFMTYATVRKEYKHVSKETKKRAESLLRSEVETYNMYLTGDVWGYIVRDNTTGEEESCWGYYGHEYCKEEALAMLKYMKESARKTDEKIAASPTYQEGIEPCTNGIRTNSA